MRSRVFAFLILIMFISSSISNSSHAYRDSSEEGRYQLNITTSMLYKTEVFDDPFGDDDLPDKGFYKTEEGLVKNEKGEKGEYAYLGYNFYNQPITNDRYFSRIGRRGNVFDQNYTGVGWQEIPEAPDSWKRIEVDPVLCNYMLTTNFYDDDHVTEGQTDTGFNLLKLFRIPEGWIHHRQLQGHIGDQ